MRKIDRRDFIKSSSKIAAGSMLLPAILTANSRHTGGTDEPSKVVVVTDDNCTEGYNINTEVLQIIVDTGITEYTEISNVGEAWMSLFPGITSDSVIGIKISLLNRYVPTRPETTQAVIEGLLQMPVPGGFDPNNIIIWDRWNSDLINAGYTINTGSTGVRCFGTTQSGIGYNYDQPLSVHIRTCYPSRILTDHIDYMINLAVIKDHSFSGATLSLKNHYGSVHNPEALHNGYCNPYIPALNQQIRDVLGDKQKFCMVDAIFGMYYGGPSGPPNFVYNGVIMSEDTVAIDRVGLDILVERGMSHAWQATHIETASQEPYNLGNYDLALIDRIDIENPSSAVSDLTGTKPTDFCIIGVYPNPFNQSAVIQYSLRSESTVNLSAYDLLGREITRLVDGLRPAGMHKAIFDGSGLSSGTYFARLTVGNLSQTQKLLLLK